MPATPTNAPPPNWGPTPPPPPGWSPQQAPAGYPGGPPPPGWAPAHAMPWVARPGAMEMLGRLAKLLGVLLIFVGVLVVVLGASVPGSCFPNGASPCNPAGNGFPGNMAWSILIGKALVVIGLAGLAAGGMARMRYGLEMPANGRAEDVNFVVAARNHNGLLIIVSILLMLLILLTVNLLPPVAVP